MKRLIVGLALFASAANAQVYLQPGEGDPRLQTVQFEPSQIIRLTVASGLQTLVELAPGENIQTIGVGDSIAWQVTASKRGDFFFVKNVSATNLTNLSVVTAARVYNFELVPADRYSALSPYHLRITFPIKDASRETAEASLAYSYRLFGSKSIRPARIYQEGTRTILEWSESRDMPGIFIEENGSETLVNGEMQEGRFIIPDAPAKIIFRLDRQTAYAQRENIPAKIDE
jgi:type IV secretion system protein VirB9